MPMYMDIHDAAGATAEVVAAAHAADVDVQGKYGVEYHKYWFNEAQGKIFCLCTAPNAEAAVQVHRNAHGLLAQKIIEVAPEIAEGFLGGCEVDAGGAALVPGTMHGEHDVGIRTVLFTDIVDSTGLMERLGDEACVGLFDVHDVIVREALAATAGPRGQAYRGRDHGCLHFGGRGRSVRGPRSEGACRASVEARRLFHKSSNRCRCRRAGGRQSRPFRIDGSPSRAALRARPSRTNARLQRGHRAMPRQGACVSRSR